MDLVALGLSIDSAGVVRSAGDLDRFAASAVKADKSAQLMVMSANKASAANDTLAGATQRVTGSFMPLATSIDKAAMSDAKLAAEAAKVVAAFGKQESAAQSLKREIDATTSEFLQYASATSRLGQAANVNGGFIGKFGQAATNASFQVQDFAVQVASGQNVMTAFAQQAPQLLGAFGFTGKLALYGSLMGTAVAVTAAVIPMLMEAGEEARSLDDVMGDLAKRTDTYVAAVKEASVSMEDLTAKYGSMAAAVRDANLAMTEVELVNATEGMSADIENATSMLKTLFEEMDSASARTAATPSGWAFQEDAANKFRDELGLVGEDLDRVRGALSALQGAGTFAEEVQAASDLRYLLQDIYGTYEAMPAPIRRIYTELKGVTVEGAEIVATADAASKSVWDIFDASAGLAANFNAANAATGGFLGTLQAAASAAWDLANARVSVAQGQVELATAMDPLGAFSGGQSASGAVQVGAGGNIRTPVMPDWVEPKKPRGGSSGGSRSGASKVQDREFDPFADLSRSTELLERQIGVVGKSEAEVARLQARWEAFDRIQKEGLTVTPEMTAQIDAQAAQVGALTQQLNDAEIAWEQFNEGVDTIAQTMADVIVGGESLRESLAGIFKGIAADLLSSGIRNAIMAQFGGMGGGGFNVLSLLGFGGGDALTGAMRGAGLPAIPSFDGGGWTGDGSRSGGLDGKGGFLAMMHPREQVSDTTKGQGAGGISVIEVRLSPEVIASILAEAEGTTIRTVQQSASAQQKALPAMIQRTNAQPRRRT